MIITHITTGLPPMIDGVGDYTALLARAREERGIEGRLFIGRTPPLDQGTFGATWGARVLDEGAPEALVDALETYEAWTVLLQFSGYAYGRRGLCAWLPEGLARWKAREPRRRLITMFHELYGFGPPWRSSFWTVGPQLWIGRALAMMSDHVVCSPRGDRLAAAPLSGRGVGHDAILQRWRTRRSTAACRARAAGRGVRQPRLAGTSVVTDRPCATAARSPRYRDHPRYRCAATYPAADTWGRVEVMGVQPADAVAAMSSARLGLMAYPAPLLAKSGVFAAYLAFGG